MKIGVLTLHLHLPGCTSLKEKRGRIKPVLSRLHREYNLATAEIDLQDQWQNAVIAAVTVSNDATHVRQMLQTVVDFMVVHSADVEVVDNQIELI